MTRNLTLGALAAALLLLAPVAAAPAAERTFGTIRDTAPGASPGAFGGAYSGTGRGDSDAYSYQRFQDRSRQHSLEREILRKQHRLQPGLPAVEAGRLRSKLYPQTENLGNLPDDSLTSKERQVQQSRPSDNPRLAPREPYNPARDSILDYGHIERNMH